MPRSLFTPDWTRRTSAVASTTFLSGAAHLRQRGCLDVGRRRARTHRQHVCGAQSRRLARAGGVALAAAGGMRLAELAGMGGAAFFGGRCCTACDWHCPISLARRCLPTMLLLAERRPSGGALRRAGAGGSGARDDAGGGGGALARAVAGAAGLAPQRRRTALVALPLALWLVYVRTKTGPLYSGVNNFSWPVFRLDRKGVASVYDLSLYRTTYRWLGCTTLLAFAGLTVQAIYFLRRPTWTTSGGGSVRFYAAMMLWPRHFRVGRAAGCRRPRAAAVEPGVLRCRRCGVARVWRGCWRAIWRCFSGVLALWNVPTTPRDWPPAGRWRRVSRGTPAMAGSATERNRVHAWAWSAGHGGLELKFRAPGSRRSRTRVVGVAQSGAAPARNSAGRPRGLAR